MRTFLVPSLALAALAAACSNPAAKPKNAPPPEPADAISLTLSVRPTQAVDRITTALTRAGLAVGTVSDRVVTTEPVRIDSATTVTYQVTLLPNATDRGTWVLLTGMYGVPAPDRHVEPVVEEPGTRGEPFRRMRALAETIVAQGGTVAPGRGTPPGSRPTSSGE